MSNKIRHRNFRISRKMSNFEVSNKKELNFYAQVQKYKESVRNRQVIQK